MKAGTGTRRLLPGLKVGDGFMRHPFDEKFGVRTSGLVAGRNLKSGHPHDHHATAYYGIAPSIFQAMVRRWRKSRPGAPIEDFSFIDIGAGMGRAVLLAAQLPFREAAGVELNPALVRIARRNLSVWRASGRARAPMKMICGDAAAARCLEQAPHRVWRAVGPDLCEQRAGACAGAASRFFPALSRQSLPLQGGCGCRPQHSHQPAGWRVCVLDL